MAGDDDHLAYGEYHGQGREESDRGLVGDLYHRLRGRSEQSQQPSVTQIYQPHLYNQQQQQQQSGPSRPAKPSGGSMSFVFDKLQEAVHDIGSEIKEKLAGHDSQHVSGQATDGTHQNNQHRFQSFAPQRQRNDVKWYVDGCAYMCAVSKALEQARETIWILDWWLSPELYLRRPPAKNEQYRVDRMLEAAAQRGVKVNIIVYKEVTQALTLSSAHTKHALEKLHPNIAVFRHPDHLPDRQTIEESFLTSLQGMKLNAATASKLPGDALKALYGANEDTVLYWAHHEKLCLIDGHIAFMGGLDLCYGRWDLNQHPIADAHPGDLKRIIFPGQDFNNARIMDFQDVSNWENNKLDRTKNSRMGWSDISICLKGPVVEDLKGHFVERWNFIYNEKYDIRKDQRYSRLTYSNTSSGRIGEYGSQGPPPQGQENQDFHPPQEQDSRDIGRGEEGERGFGGQGGFQNKLMDRFGDRVGQIGERFGGQFGEQYGHHGHHAQGQDHHGQFPSGSAGGADIQLTRSCAKWSNGTAIEHSIANAYIEIIRNSQHFVYIENQFFITAVNSEQKKPIKNRIGGAIVERIVRAARNGEKFKMIVMIPAIPAFAGDLKTDDALSTRAIMEFQYNSINRGNGASIYEQIAKEGIDPMEYIRFYNLRSYDRINASGVMREAEQRSGVSYEDARRDFDNSYTGGYNQDQQGYGEQQGYDQQQGYGGQQGYDQNQGAYQQYEQGTQSVGSHQGLGSGRWDSVSECYMLGGEDIRNVPWEGGEMDEIDAFVSEELYIHSKVLIADDRIVICGSANLNDRSQLGDHDSEIAVIIEDTTPLDSRMNGQQWRASKFAGTLRRHLFKKHLGLLPPQDMEKIDENCEPIGVANKYDFGSEEDRLVTDPLSDEFQNFWNSRAKTNTDAFAHVFHPVPYDGVRTWKQYDEYYERFFGEEKKDKEDKKLSTYKWGHVVGEDFPGGVREVKEVLSTIRGTLVEMPLLFLKDEDIAKEGLGLNAFTEDVYT